MDIHSVPQEGNATLGGHRKAMYARDADGRMVIAPSRGWEVEEIVTTHAVETLQALAATARERVRAGLASPLEYWMYERRMDTALLAQTSGFWQWRVKRHLRPEIFARLSAAQLERYAHALGLSPDTIRHLP
ncbi:MAG TPA: hypothetical protein VE029_03350 [Rhizobacter sp.]|nr:hypothetical protein [Rhizobacter sp.]